NTLIGSVVLFTVTTFFYLWMHAFIPLLILRFIHGISFSIVTAATSAMAADIVPKSRRGAGLGYFAMAMNLAVVAGPFIGLSLFHFISFTAFFVVLSVLMGISVVVSFFVELAVEQQPDHTRPSLGLKWSDLLQTKAL